MEQTSTKFTDNHIGMRVIGNHLACSYVVTTTGWVGIITNVNSNDSIDAVGIDGTVFSYLSSKCFDLIEPGEKKEDLVVTKIKSDVYSKEEKPIEDIINNNKTYKNMNLIDKIRTNIKGKPMSTLIKNDVLTLNETLTSTGKELFNDFLFTKFKDEFVNDIAPKLEELNDNE